MKGFNSLFRTVGSRGLIWGVLVCFALSACSPEPSVDKDGTNSDTSLTDGAGQDVADASVSDTPADDLDNPEQDVSDAASSDIGFDISLDAADDTVEDVNQLPCGQLCEVDETCFEGVCIRECGDGLGVEELHAQLAPGAQIVANFCTDTTHTVAHVVLPTYEMLEFRALSTGGSTALRLVRWPLYLSDGPSSAETIVTQVVPGLVETWDVLPAPFIGTAPDHALVGYATNGEGLGGAALRVQLSPPYSTDMVDAGGIAGGELLNDNDMLSYSFRFGTLDQGLGVYYRSQSEDKVVRVVDDLGQSSGDIVRVGEHVLITGYSDNWESCDGQDEAPSAGKRIFVFAVQELKTAFDNNTTLYARCSALQLNVEADFTGLGDGYVLTRETDGAFQNTGLELHQLNVDTELGQAQLSGSIAVTEGTAFLGGRKMEGADILLLQHEAGFMMIKADYLGSDDITD